MNNYAAEISLGSYNKLHISAESTDQLLQALADLAAVSPGVVEQVNVVASAGKAVGASIERPASKATAEPGSSPAPKCDCGIPYNDCEGKKTKAGAPYKFRYYSACKSDDCKPKN